MIFPQSCISSNVKVHTPRSVNEVICHGIPDRRKLVEGDIINIGMVTRLLKRIARLRFLRPDVSLYYDGKYSVFVMKLRSAW